MSSFWWKGHFYFQNFSSKSSGWHGAICPWTWLCFSSPSIVFCWVSIKFPSGYHCSSKLLEFLKYWHGNSLLSWMPLKHLGLADLPMIKGLPFPPLALVKDKHVSLSFDFLPPVQIWEASVSDLFRRALKYWLSSTFQILQGCHLCRISGSLSVNESTISSLTSPDSIEISFALKCMSVISF